MTWTWTSADAAVWQDLRQATTRAVQQLERRPTLSAAMAAELRRRCAKARKACFPTNDAQEVAAYQRLLRAAEACAAGDTSAAIGLCTERVAAIEDAPRQGRLPYQDD